MNESVWNREFSLCLGVSDVDARGVMPFKQVKAQAHCQLRQLFQISIFEVGSLFIVYKILHRQDSKNATRKKFTASKAVQLVK